MSVNGRLHSSLRMGWDFTALLLATGILTVVAGCGGGGSNSGGGGGSSPTIISVSVACASASVPTGQTGQCSATVTGTGSYSSGVVWAVNGTSGGSATYGAISAGGLYQAPATAPAAYIVTVSAMSSMDSTKSGSFSVLIAGTIASATQPITASAGGTISLPGGDSATIPAGSLSGDTVVTLQLSSVATQPTNTLFSGIGPSLLMSFSPAVSGVGTAASHRLLTANDAATTSAITFVLQGGQVLSTTQLQGALGVMDVNDGHDNYFALQSSYDTAQNLTTLQVDPTMVEGGSTLQIGLTLPLSTALSEAGNATLVEWNQAQQTFTSVPTSSTLCAQLGPRTLVVIHGMDSDAMDSFGPGNPPTRSTYWAKYANGTYSTILGINYSWTSDIITSSQSVAAILNSLFDSDATISPCNYQGLFDIEAHSEGTIVTLAAAQSGAKYLTASTESKLKHVVLVAGPIDGTPAASNIPDFLTFYLNQTSPGLGGLVPVAVSTFGPFIDGLQPNSSTILAAQAAASQNLTSAEIIAVGGDKPYLDQLMWWQNWLVQVSLLGAPNDGIIPVSSSLPTDSSLPNLVRLVGNDPATGDYPYPDNHTNLVNNQNVMPNVLAALNGGGETAQVSLNITPPSTTLAPGQAILLTANVANMLNPQLQWSVLGGTGNGTLSPSTGNTVEYTAPASPGGPFDVSASILALPVTFPPAQLTASESPGEVTINPLSVTVPATNSQTFTATVIGGGSVAWGIWEGTVGGTITNTGVYTAPAQTGTYHVVATNAANSSESGTATVNVVTGPSITTIHSFNHTTEGANPWAAPAWGSDGNMYGVTEAGGDLSCVYFPSVAGCGTIYEIDTSEHVTTLHSFTGQDGAYPIASLLATASGTFYGTTFYGGTNTSECDAGGTLTPAGCGSVFSYSATAGFASVLSFGPFNSLLGVGPVAPLFQTGGTFYGTNDAGGNTSCTGTLGGATESGCGAVFSINSSNAPFALHTFAGSEGAYPTAGLLQSNGYLYGITQGGGTLTCSSYAAPGCGTVFQMNLSGTTFKTLHSFTEADGANPWSPLILGADGNMYGATIFGGNAACSGGAQWQGCGTVFKIDTGGNFESLHSFSGPDGAYPTSIMQASDGYFYGTTEGGGDASCAGRYGPGCGTVFRMDSAGNVTVLYSFTGKSDGSWPESAVIQGTDGNLYGTAVYGGVNDDGVIFRISNLASLTLGAAVASDFSNNQPAITPVLKDRPHVGPPGPPVFTQP